MARGFILLCAFSQSPRFHGWVVAMLTRGTALSESTILHTDVPHPHLHLVSFRHVDARHSICHPNTSNVTYPIDIPITP